MSADEELGAQRSHKGGARTTVVVGAVVWLLFVANLAYDVISDGRVSGFSVVVFTALVIGTIYARARGISGRTPGPYVWATYVLIALVLLALAIYMGLSPSIL